MTKTPDEIKKGLNDPIPVHFHIVDPEPRLTPLMMVDLEELHADALALIQQLGTENKQYHQENTEMYSEMCMLREKVHRLEAERDAAVADLRGALHCPSCANWRKPEKAAVCFACQYGRTRRFEWRGVPKEE